MSKLCWETFIYISQIMTFLRGKMNHGDLHVVLNQPLYQL